MQNLFEIDNDVYNRLGDRWYTAFDDPVALLRQESKIKFPWIIERIRREIPTQSPESLSILDVGCGGGFLSNHLSKENFQVTGVDISEDSLRVAKLYDKTKKVKYFTADAYQLPFQDKTFDVACAMDFLEHVDKPEQVIKEISRVLKPGGLFFFHTFNRNFLAHMVIIKMVELLVKNTPKNMHVIELFITPRELSDYCLKNFLDVKEMTGLRPIFSTITLKGLFTRTVPQNFSFKLTPSLKLSYMGYAKKQ